MQTDQKTICDFLTKHVAYNADTGELTWKSGPPDCRRKDTPQIDHQGYKRITFKKNRILAHRAAWFLHYGVLPNGIIDHIDGNRSNNSIENLRVTTFQTNAQNRRKGSGRSHFLGVTVKETNSGTKFIASIRTNGRLTQLGTYATPELAHAVYLSAKKQIHPGSHMAEKAAHVDPVLKIASSGHRNIYPNKSGFQVKFKRHKENVCFGTYESLEKAIAVRDQVKGGIYGAC